MRPPPFKIFMITKRENYMGRHFILALFEAEPILHLSFFGLGANIFNPKFFFIWVYLAHITLTELLYGNGKNIWLRIELFIDIATIPLVILRAKLFRATRLCKMVMFAKRESNLSDESFLIWF